MELKDMYYKNYLNHIIIDYLESVKSIKLNLWVRMINLSET